MKHRRIATEQAFIMMGFHKIPKMKAFRWEKRKCARWARAAGRRRKK